MYYIVKCIIFGKIVWSKWFHSNSPLSMHKKYFRTLIYCKVIETFNIIVKEMLVYSVGLSELPRHGNMPWDVFTDIRPLSLQHLEKHTFEFSIKTILMCSTFLISRKFDFSCTFIQQLYFFLIQMEFWSMISRKLQVKTYTFFDQ